MITLKSGDIFGEQADVLVNPVNCVGVMGKGLALAFRNRFPENYEEYKSACGRGEVVPGRMFVHATGGLRPRYVFNFPTKRHWRDGSEIGDIEQGLADLKRQAEQLDVTSIAVPALGSGLGGLDWKVVLPLIREQLDGLADVDVSVFGPQ